MTLDLGQQTCPIPRIETCEPRSDQGLRLRPETTSPTTPNRLVAKRGPEQEAVKEEEQLPALLLDGHRLPPPGSVPNPEPHPPGEIREVRDEAAGDLPERGDGKLEFFQEVKGVQGGPSLYGALANPGPPHLTWA